MTPKTVVYAKHEQRFDLAGQPIPRSLCKVDESISAGLAKRLQAYAIKRMKPAGLPPFYLDWQCVVETADAELPPAERAYSVYWVNDDLTEIGVQGILTNRGWPFLDHGIFLNA